MAMLPAFDAVSPYLCLLGPAIAIFLFLLIVLVETAALQLLRWGDFKRSVKASLWMNIASMVAGLFLFGIVDKLGFPGVIILWALSIFIEAFILFALHWREDRLNIIAAVVANTASYVLLVIPAVLLSK